MKRLFIALASAAGVGVLVLVSGLWLADRSLNQPLAVDGEDFSYEIRPGMPFATISAELAELGVLEHPELFRWYARLSGQASEARAGEYRVAAGTTPRQLLQKFVSGEVLLHSFTIVEGWNVRELFAALNAHESVTGIADLQGSDELLQGLGSDAAHLEGLFLPETYHFPKDTSTFDVIKQAHELMQETLAEEWQGRDTGLPLTTPYEALILASIVEKETARADERARIAGVFTRRLQQGMRLQTDPTVIYGIGPEFNGNLTRTDLRTDTPYNTYTRRGLPPTPIALPGRAAIHAALHPAPGKEIYFVATGLGDGSHAFSETKAEHDAAVQEYLKRRRAARNGM